MVNFGSLGVLDLPVHPCLYYESRAAAEIVEKYNKMMD
jgi:hypothetical protein